MDSMWILIKVLMWDVDKSFGAKVGRGDNGGVDSDVDIEVVSGDDKGFLLEPVYEVGSGDDSSCW